MDLNKRILLVNPPSDSPTPVLPLGLAYLAAYLEKSGFEVKVIDAWADRLTFEEIGRLSSESNPSIVGVTMMSPTYIPGMRTVDAIRKTTVSPIVVGGPHPSAVPEQCLIDNQNIDFVVMGEGESAFTRLAKAILFDTEGLNGIQGIAFRSDDGLVKNNGLSPQIRDLDSLPLPARHLFPNSKYRTHPPFGKKNPYMTMISSRGCAYKCTYCTKSVFGNRYRSSSPETVIKEIKQIIDNYGIREIHFYDDDFTMNMKRTAQICDLLIKENIKISWSCTTRVNLVSEELLSKMKKAGCWLICYGVESADPEILKTILKGYTIEEVKNAFQWTKQARIRTVGYFMLGLPGETIKTIQKTIDFSLSLNPDFVSWGITALFPGSYLYDEAKSGQLGKTIARYEYKDTQDSWHASASPFGNGYSIILEDTFTREELKLWAKKANRRFYLRFSYLLSFLFKVRSFSELLHYIRNGLSVFTFLLR